MSIVLWNKVEQLTARVEALEQKLKELAEVPQETRLDTFKKTLGLGKR